LNKIDECLTFKNARSAVVGLMGRKDSTNAVLQYVSFIAYEIMGTNMSKGDQFKRLGLWGFETPASHVYCDHENITSKLVEAYQTFKSESGYLIDGLVITDSARTCFENVYLPKGTMAFKVNTLVSETVLLDVEFSGPSKSGKFVPIAILDPVELGGASIGRASCYNVQWIKDNGVAYGEFVVIEKSGEIIPRIKSFVEPRKTEPLIEIPTYCSSCGSKLELQGVDLICANHDHCPAQIGLIVKSLGCRECVNQIIATVQHQHIRRSDQLETRLV